MPDGRYLIRLTNSARAVPAQASELLQRARSLAVPLSGKVINLRVTPLAIEFDLFCDPALSLDPFFEQWELLGSQLSLKRLDLPRPPVEPQKIVDEARQLFNEQRYWEVHEVLEDLWRERRGAEKQWIQGLILVAAALVHLQKAETAVAWPMLQDASRRLQGAREEYYGWDLRKFSEALTRAIATQKADFQTV